MDIRAKRSIKKRVAESMEKSKQVNEFLDWLLKQCKEHGGPIITLKELNWFLKSTYKEDKKKFLRQDVQFQKITHKKDSIGRPKLRTNFFFYQGFLSRTFTIHRTAGERGGYSFTPLYRFYPLHRHLDIRSQTLTGNL